MTRTVLAALCVLLSGPAWGQTGIPCSTLGQLPCNSSNTLIYGIGSYSLASPPLLIQILPHDQSTLFMFEDGSPDRATFYANGKPIVLDFGKGTIDLGGMNLADAVKALKDDLTTIVGQRQ